MTHPGPSDALWLAGTAFLLVLVLAGTLVPLYAALFFRPKPGDPVTRLEIWLVRFGNALLYASMVVVGGLVTGFGVTVFARVWGLR